MNGKSAGGEQLNAGGVVTKNQDVRIEGPPEKCIELLIHSLTPSMTECLID